MMTCHSLICLVSYIQQSLEAAMLFLIYVVKLISI